MAQGGDVGSIRGDSRETSSWLQRLSGKMAANRQGLSTTNNQQELQSGGLRGNVGRGIYSPISSSNWQASLGLAPTASYDGAAQGGDARVNTGRSAAEYKGKSDLADTDSVQTYSKDGSVSYGGNRNIYTFGYGNEDAQQIAESGNVGMYAKDRSGQALSVNPMNNLSQEAKWDKQTASGGKGYSSEQGFYNAKLDNPSDRVIFNNKISQNLAGEGRASSETLSDSDNSSSSKELSNISKAVPLLSKIPLIGDMFKSHDKETLDQYDTNSIAQQKMNSSGYLSQPGMAEYGIQSSGGMKTAMDTPGDYILSQSDVSGAQGGRLAMQRGASGYLNQANAAEAVGGASLQDQQHEWKKMFGKEHQTRDMRGGPQNLEASAGLMTDAGVKTNTKLEQNIPQDWINKNIDPNILSNFDSYKKRYPGLYSKYTDASDFVTKQYAIANPQAVAAFNNQSQATQSAYANGVGSNIDASANVAGNIAASGQGVEGNLSHTANSYTQDPSAFIYMPQFGTYAYVEGLKHWAQNTKTELTGDMKQDSGVINTLMTVGGQLTQNNELRQEMMRSVEDISSKLPQTEYGQNLISKLRGSPELAALFNTNSSPEAIAKTIINYDVQKNETSLGVNVIPGVGAAQIKGAPATLSTVKADSTLETKIPRGQTREFDPTPDKPGSGDEIVLANVNGNVQEIQRGKLVSQNYVDTLTTSLTVPQGAATGWQGQTTGNASPEEMAQQNQKYQEELANYDTKVANYQHDYNSTINYYYSQYAHSMGPVQAMNYAKSIADNYVPRPTAPVKPTQTTSKAYTASDTPINQQQQLSYNQYYYTPGDNQQYNDLVTAGLNRYYDDNTGYDYSGIDPMIAQIQAGLASSQDGSYGGYTADDWNTAINLYNQQKQYDDTGYNQFINNQKSIASQLRYY